MDFRKHAYVLAIVDCLHENGSWTGKTHVQKSLSLLRDRGEVEVPFEFVLYRHGPYSFEVESAIEEMLIACGVNWKRGNITWTATPKIIGMKRGGITPVDMADQQGVYFLFARNELIHVGDRTQAWAGTYEPELSGIWTAQAQVARGVAKALAVKLLPAEEARLAVVRTVDPLAYEAYLEGSALWKTMRKADLDAAQRLFDQALEKDPSYAPAYSGLAWVWMARQQMGHVPESEGVPKAKEAALKALALDDGSAEAHEAMATVLTWGEWDWSGAQTEWTRTFELDPNRDNAHAYYAHYLAHRGRAAEGLRHSDLAVKLDPFNALNQALRGIVLLYLRRFDEALAAGRAAMSLQPNLSIGFTVMQRVYIVKGMRDEQLADQRLRIAKDAERIAAFERGLAEGGYEGAQRGIADVLAVRFEKGQYYSASFVALRYLDAGDNDRAIDWLQKAYDKHDSELPYINSPPWDRLRDDPRYQALLRRIGLPANDK